MEVSQYNFELAYLTAPPKHVKLPSKEGDIRGIAGIEATKNPFEAVNIQEAQDINEIV